MTARKTLPRKSAPGSPDGLAVIAFETARDWRAWLEKNHASSAGVWLRCYKKGVDRTTISHADALDEALCFGWIDSQARGLDEESFLQRYTPRSRRSVWSKINRDHIARLIKEKRMKPAGLAEVDRAKKDGRWDAAYDSFGSATPPDDFRAALAKNKAAKAFFTTLSRQNLYAIYFRLHHAKKSETRARRVAQFVEMLAEGRTIHPQKTKPSRVLKGQNPH